MQRVHDTDRPVAEQPLLGMGLRLITALLLALMFAGVKLASQRGVNVLESLFYRQIGTALCATGWVAMGPGFASLRTRRVRAHISRMALGLTAMGLNFLAFILLPLAEATAIGFTVPIFAVVLAALVLHEPTGRWRWSAVAAGFIGVLLIVQPTSGQVPLLGASVALVAALLTASVTIVIRRLGKTERAATRRFANTGIGGTRPSWRSGACRLSKWAAACKLVWRRPSPRLAGARSTTRIRDCRPH